MLVINTNFCMNTAIYQGGHIGVFIWSNLQFRTGWSIYLFGNIFRFGTEDFFANGII